MAILWDILDTIRRKLIETLDVRTVIISDDEIPASLLPAVRIKFIAASSDFETGVPVIFDILIKIEILLKVGSTEQQLADMILNASEALVECDYPSGARIDGAPAVQNIEGTNAAIKIKIRWAERSE